jgi:hypothetical protein
MNLNFVSFQENNQSEVFVYLKFAVKGLDQAPVTAFLFIDSEPIEFPALFLYVYIILLVKSAWLPELILIEKVP